jgi:hypothetical protein
MINLLSSRSGGALSYVRNLIPLIARDFIESNEHQLVLLVDPSQKLELPALDVSTACVDVK